MTGCVQLLMSLIQHVEAGQACALCTVVGTRGSTPQDPGAMLLVHADGTTAGTLGGGCVEGEVRRRALAMLTAGESGRLSFDLDGDYGWDDGLICGGGMEIAVVSITVPSGLEPFRDAVPQLREGRPADIPLRIRHNGGELEYRLHVEPTPTLVIAGAGHVGAALAKLAVDLDYRVVVMDDRGDLMRPDRLAPPIECEAGDITGALRDWPIDANTYVVIVTRGHRHDEQALHAVIDSPAKYIGMIGSRRKIKQIFDDLVELGVERAKLDRVYSPIGLEIGAVTVPEIAVSIAAEMTRVRRAERVTKVEGPFEVRGGGG